MKRNNKLIKSLGYSLFSMALVFLMVFLLISAKAPQVSADTGEWLDGWDNRIEITVDQTKIDSDLTHFPVLVYLSSASGQNNDDLTAVFDEVGSNSKKIAATTDDGETPLYVEVEKWDVNNEEAWLWVSGDNWTLSGIQDTILYLYYDNDQSDNTAYVGNTGSSVTANVWDSQYKGVWHLNNQTSGDVLDSTANNYDGTNYGATIGQSGEIDGAFSFNGTDNYVYRSVNNFEGTSNIGSISAWVKTTYDHDQRVFASSDEDYDYNYMGIMTLANGTLCMQHMVNHSHTMVRGNSIVNDDAWHHICVTSDGSVWYLYVDGVPETITVEDGANNGLWFDDVGNRDNITIGIMKRQTGLYNPFDGFIDEVRVTNVTDSTAWVKADYYNTIDNLLSFDIEVLDTTPPAAISDLIVSSNSQTSLTLTWTAPGDDGNVGTASQYDIRYSTSPIYNETTWNNSANVTGEPAPLVAGTRQSFVVTGLSPDTIYYFAIRAEDEIEHLSDLNFPYGKTLP